MYQDGTRCKNEVCLGSDLCVQHLEYVGISVTTKYKRGSRVVDKISRVYTKRFYKKDELVLRLYNEHLSSQDHIDRYQRADRTGPHEFGFKHNGEY